MKKFGKILLFGAAVGTAAAAAYHYFRKMEKDADNSAPEADEDSFVNEEDSYFDDEDFDDELEITVFQEEDLDEDNEDAPGECFEDPTPDTDIEDIATASPAPSFSPLAETLMQEEDVEEFFDEDDEALTEK